MFWETWWCMLLALQRCLFTLKHGFLPFLNNAIRTIATSPSFTSGNVLFSVVIFVEMKRVLSCFVLFRSTSRILVFVGLFLLLMNDSLPVSDRCNLMICTCYLIINECEKLFCQGSFLWDVYTNMCGLAWPDSDLQKWVTSMISDNLPKHRGLYLVQSCAKLTNVLVQLHIQFFCTLPSRKGATTRTIAVQLVHRTFSAIISYKEGNILIFACWPSLC